MQNLFIWIYYIFVMFKTIAKANSFILQYLLFLDETTDDNVW